MSRVLPILFNTEMVQAILDGRKTVTRRFIKFLHGKNPNWTGYVKDGLMLYNVKNEPCIKPPRYRVGDYLYVRETWGVMRAKRYDAIVDIKYKAGGENKTICFPYGGTDNINRYEFDNFIRKWDGGEGILWHPSIHMPKSAARIWLKVTDVRVERLRDITEEQAIKEGIARLYDDLPDAEYIDWAKGTGVYPKAKEDWGYKNYLWHGNFGMHGTRNKLSDAWKYQYSSYDSAIDSFSSLWNTTVPLKEWNIYGWAVNPWVWAIEFERCEKPESEV